MDKILIMCSFSVAAGFHHLNPKYISSKTNLKMQSNTICVFGATGQTGSECVYQALKSGYNVI